ncbi:hypothetical protein [Niastella sp. OAS944]|uniref:hypothetical protein n=1 Tax=Niastella sp. OAS944 TaxID=2664089 RepID=UPI003475DB2D|nr:hypothetical protein [Chitinophagaceae bacterium OAS944]
MCNTGINKIRLLVIHVVIMLVLTTPALGQNKNNQIELTAINTGFNLSNASALETQQVKTNAFQITATSKSSNNFRIFAKVSSSTSSTATPLPASMLAVRLNSVSPTVTANFNTVILSTSDQTLQTLNTTNTPITFNYDLLAGPIGYSYAPGTYNLTMLFTMTQP